MNAVRLGDVSALGNMLADDPSLVSAHDYDMFGGTALIQAVGGRNREVVDLLLDHGADINQRSDWWAGSFGVLPNDDRETAEYLISRGATVDVHTAAHMGMVDRLRELLDAGPSLVHARGGDGQLPLHFAGTPETIDLLLERGADIHARDIDHESTAAQWQATRNAEATRHLVRRGAEPDIFIAAATDDVGLLEKLLTDEPQAINHRVTTGRFDTSANTSAMHIYLYTLGYNAGPLHTAAMRGGVAATKLLLQAGADIHAGGGYDNASPLHLAASWNRVAVADVLLDHGADINLTRGPTHDNEPVGWAVVAGAVEMVRLLADRGARIRDVHRKDAVSGSMREYNYNGVPVEHFHLINELLTNNA